MTIFYLPDLGEGLAEAEVREWYVKEGDIVKVDQPLVSMETAKAVVDVPSPYNGKIVKLHGNANAIIKTGAPFITFELEGKTVSSVISEDQGSVVGKLEASEKKWDDGQVIIGAAKTSSNQIKAMPAARVLAQQFNIDLKTITPTGPQGMITAEDVKKCFSTHHSGTTTAFQLPGETESLHGVRRVMAQAMMQSHREIVPVTIIEDADITNLEKGTDFTAHLLKAIAYAVTVEPAMNAWFDGSTLSRKIFKEVNVGLATDTKDGLFVPVVKDVENKTITELRSIIDRYKKTVVDRTIAPSDMQGATITLSNFGTITGKYATPIIVPPAVAILGCGRGREGALVRDGQIVVGRIVPLSLTFDHRAATGGEATRFLGAVVNYLSGQL